MSIARETFDRVVQNVIENPTFAVGISSKTLKETSGRGLTKLGIGDPSHVERYVSKSDHRPTLSVLMGFNMEGQRYGLTLYEETGDGKESAQIAQLVSVQRTPTHPLQELFSIEKLPSQEDNACRLGQYDAANQMAALKHQ